MPTTHERPSDAMRPLPATGGASPVPGSGDPASAPVGSPRPGPEAAPRRNLAALVGPVMVAVAVQSASNLVLHAALGRSLSAADYGALGAVLAAMTLVAVPLTALQTAAARLAADELNGPTARAALRRVALLLLGPALVAGLLAGPAAAYLRLDSTVDAALVAPLLLVSGLASAGRGLLLGQGRTRAVAASYLVGSLARLALGLALAARWGVTGALVGTVLSEVAALLAVAIPLRGLRTGRVRALRMGDVARTTVVVTGLFAFTTIDLFLARHHLGGSDSGAYVMAATIGKTVLALPAAAMSVAYPRLVSAWRAAARGGRPPGPVLTQALVIVGGPALLAAAVVLAAPGVVVGGLYGSAFPGTDGLTRALVAIAAASALVSVLAHAGLARGSRTALVPWAGALLEVLLIEVWHGTPLAIAAGSAAALVLVLAVLAAAEVRAWRGRPAPAGVAGNAQAGT